MFFGYKNRKKKITHYCTNKRTNGWIEIDMADNLLQSCFIEWINMSTFVMLSEELRLLENRLIWLGKIIGLKKLCPFVSPC